MNHCLFYQTNCILYVFRTISGADPAFLMGLWGGGGGGGEGGGGGGGGRPR